MGRMKAAFEDFEDAMNVYSEIIDKYARRNKDGGRYRALEAIHAESGERTMRGVMAETEKGMEA